MKKYPFFDDICELDAINRELENLQKQITLCEDDSKTDAMQKKIDCLKERKSRIEEKTESYYGSINDEINRLSDILSKLGELKTASEKMKKQYKKETILSEIQAAEERISFLETKIPPEGVTVTFEDDRDYKQYLHNQELLDEIELIEESLYRTRKSKSKSNRLEIIKIAKSSLLFRNEVLRQKQGVRCLINFDIIGNAKRKCEEGKMKLRRYELQEKEIKALEEEIKRLLNGSSESEIKVRLKELKEQKELHIKALDYAKIRHEIEEIKETLERNKRIFAYLKETYEDISQEEFDLYTEQIYS